MTVGDPRNPRQTAVAGFRIGLIALQTAHELVPGNPQNACSFDFPVLYDVVQGVSVPALLRGDRDAAAAIVESALRLETAGVRAIVGLCGSFGNYQTAAAEAVDIPVFMSVLLQVPLLLRSLATTRKLGILFANAASFTSQISQQCGIESADRIVAVSFDSVDSFRPILEQGGLLDNAALGRDAVNLARSSLDAHPTIGAWLLQCSDLAPYANLIQRATGRPVFDVGSMIRHLYQCAAPHRYPL